MLFSHIHIESLLFLVSSVGKLILAAQHTEEKFLSGVVDTGEQFFGGVVDTGVNF